MPKLYTSIASARSTDLNLACIQKRRVKNVHGVLYRTKECIKTARKHDTSQTWPFIVNNSGAVHAAVPIVFVMTISRWVSTLPAGLFAPGVLWGDFGLKNPRRDFSPGDPTWNPGLFKPPFGFGVKCALCGLKVLPGVADAALASSATTFVRTANRELPKSHTCKTRCVRRFTRAIIHTRAPTSTA